MHQTSADSDTRESQHAQNYDPSGVEDLLDSRRHAKSLGGRYDQLMGLRQAFVCALD